MLMLRQSNDRGKTKTPWLDSKHTFSFAEYFDSQHVQFGPLRVINEDIIAPGAGFPTHPHHDMEIITYVIDGVIEHHDSMGNGSLIKPGEIQRMSAGTGVRHSEFNHSKEKALHLLQIWIHPDRRGLSPSYEQKQFQKIPNQLILIGGNNGHFEAIKIHQDVKLYSAFLTPGFKLPFKIEESRQLWIQLISGNIEVNKQFLSAGDGLGVSDENEVMIACKEEAAFLLFDLGG